jgi:hypothetical protein
MSDNTEVRAAFEAWLAKNPSPLFWNTSDAMFAAWHAALAQQAATPAPAEPVAKVTSYVSAMGGRYLAIEPLTEPPVAIGALLYAAAPATPAAPPAAQAGDALTDDRIAEIADSDECHPDTSGWGSKFDYRLFARAIEREVRAALKGQPEGQA